MKDSPKYVTNILANVANEVIEEIWKILAGLLLTFCHYEFVCMIIMSVFKQPKVKIND